MMGNITPTQLICVMNQVIFLATPNCPKPDFCASSTWCHKKEELFISITAHWNSWFWFFLGMHDRALSKQGSYFYQWKFSPRIYILNYNFSFSF